MRFSIYFCPRVLLCFACSGKCLRYGNGSQEEEVPSITFGDSMPQVTRQIPNRYIGSVCARPRFILRYRAISYKNRSNSLRC